MTTAARSYAVEFAMGDVAGFATLVVGPGAAAYWAGLRTPGPLLVLVNDDAVVPPRRAESWEIRAEGLWADANCETPGEHWSFGLEAFGIAFDDADDALTSDVGDRIALGLDIEWEAPDVVHGEVLVGTERIEFDGRGRLSTPAAASPRDLWAALVRPG
jgi:hypothetical protein